MLRTQARRLAPPKFGSKLLALEMLISALAAAAIVSAQGFSNANFQSPVSPSLVAAANNHGALECAQQAWPYYGDGCLRSAGASAVRVIAMTRGVNVTLRR